ncbi:MAG TPA: hypothetical protein VIQ05_08300, partial [Tardiphaga sp.]
MPVRPAQLPEATPALVDTIADVLARERGGIHLVTAADLRKHLSDPKGQLGRLFTDWKAARMAGETSGPAEGSLVAAAKAEVENQRRGRLVKRLGREAVDGLDRRAAAAKRAGAAPDLST